MVTDILGVGVGVGVEKALGNLEALLPLVKSSLPSQEGERHNQSLKTKLQR